MLITASKRAVAIIADRVPSHTNEHSGDLVRYDVIIGRNLVGRVSIQSHYSLGVAISDEVVVVWAGNQAYVTSGAGFAEHALEDEIQAFYVVGGYWWVVCELSVALIDSATGEKWSRRGHNEPITSSWWQDESLFFVDFIGRCYKVVFVEEESQLTWTEVAEEQQS